MRFTRTVRSNHTGVVTNEYFLDHPERIIHTEAKRDTDPYGKPAMVYTHSGGVEGISMDLYKMLPEDLSVRLDLERYNGMGHEKPETRQNIAVQSSGIEVKMGNSLSGTDEQTDVKREENRVQPQAHTAETRQPETPVMDLYDLFGYTQEERRLAERGLKPERKKGGKSKPKKPVQASLFVLPEDGTGTKTDKGKTEAGAAFTPEEAKEMEEIIRGTAEVEAAPVETTAPKAEDTAPPQEDVDPEDAVYRSLDWETNPPINGFYEMMMDLTPERRAELRRLGKAKMEANAARQTVGISEAKREKGP